MIINHNLGAMNAHRQMGTNQINASKNMEKLSSGLRINRAGDDAAGLSISEKMRGQIRGLSQASRNAQDGISLIQTAEGALDETHSILQRMRELSVQAGNDTNIAEDRNAIAEELKQLTTEIDRIANTTEFNKQKLLDGGFNGTFQIGANQGQTIDVSVGKMTSNALGLVTGVKLNAVAGVANGKLVEGTYTFDANKNVLDAKGNIVGTVDESNGTITLGDKKTTIALGHSLDTSELSKSSFTVNAKGDTQITLAPRTPNSGILAAGDYRVSGTNLMNGDKVIGTLEGTELTLTGETDPIDLAGYGLIDTDLDDGVTFTVNGVDVSTSEKASGSITSIDKALEQVSNQRSQLGAVQNRLEHTIKNLNNAAENTQAAESRIRDVDMAKEMMEMTKNNILQQASQAMLAQANQAPQQVLQLLR